MGTGSGTEDDPCVILNYEQLKTIRDDLSKRYALGDNIDAEASWEEGSAGCNAYDGNTIPSSNPCSGWSPLGDPSTNFTGSLDGRDHVISKLYVNLSNSENAYAGLFGYVGEGASINNVGFTKLSITAFSSAGLAYAGGLAGYNAGGTISNSYAAPGYSFSSVGGSGSSAGGLVGYNTGTINNSYASVSGSIYSHFNAGGLVGYNAGGAISNSYASISGSAFGRRSGGLVGRNEHGTISNSYAALSGTLSAASYGGGLAGVNASGTISNSYAAGSGSVSANSSELGGLVGYNTGTISNSYAAVSVTSLATAGGLVGENDGGTISNNNYWDIDATGLTEACSSGTCSAVGLTTAEMQAISGIYPDMLGNAFQLTSGQYPKVYKEDSTDELTLGQ